MAQWVETLASKPDNLCLSPGTHVAGKLSVESCPLTSTHKPEHSHIHKRNFYYMNVDPETKSGIAFQNAWVCYTESFFFFETVSLGSPA